MLIVHTHFHPRHTGVSSHVEAMVKAQQAHAETALWGGHILDPALPRIGFSTLLKRARKETVVIHAHRNHEALRALVLQKLAPRIRVVLTRHSDTPPSALTQSLLSRCNARVVLSRHYAHRIHSPSAVIGHGVDLKRFGVPASRMRAFRALELPGQHAMGVVGRIRKSKGQADFVEAFAQLKHEAVHWTALLVGNVKSADRAWLERTVGQSNVQWRAHAESIESVYQGLSVLVQPSHAESFGLVALEAMACGTCVIASDLPATDGLVIDNVTGIRFEVGNVTALHEKIVQVINDSALRERLGAAAAEHVQKHFGLETEAASLAALYRSL
jgi:mannosyltransferase